jgi:hypothetical protein
MLPAGRSWTKQRILVHDAGSLMAYVYVLRVPLLLCAAVGALPLIALPRDAVAGSLLRGLFDIADPSPPSLWVPFTTFALLTFAGLMAAVTITITARLILLDGSERFQIQPLPESPGIQLMLRLPLGAATMLVVGHGSRAGGVLSGWDARRSLHGGQRRGFPGLDDSTHERLWDAVFMRPASPETTNNAIVLVAEFMFAGFERLVRLTPAGFVDQSGKIRARHAFAVLQFRCPCC